MLRDVVRRRRRRRRRLWAHAPVIHAACNADHEKRVAWVPISMHTCGPFPIVMDAPLGGPSGRRRSAITRTRFTTGLQLRSGKLPTRNYSIYFAMFIKVIPVKSYVQVTFMLLFCFYVVK